MTVFGPSMVGIWPVGPYQGIYNVDIGPYRGGLGSISQHIKALLGYWPDTLVYEWCTFGIESL